MHLKENKGNVRFSVVNAFGFVCLFLLNEWLNQMPSFAGKGEKDVK